MKPIPSYQKLRGGYYTPKPIADFLTRWAIQSPEAKVLEPSCGDGILLQSALEALSDCGADRQKAAGLVFGVEIDAAEAQKALVRTRLPDELLPTVSIHVGDFFAYCKAHLSEKQLFDAIIGNPPFVRYQNFPEEHRAVAFELMRDAGLHPNRLTNSWVPFLVATTLLLKTNGRMAMVVPAELLQVNYAAELRRFLSEYYSYLSLVTFKKLVFNGIQQEVVLVLGERNGRSQTGIRVIQLGGMGDLEACGKTMYANLQPVAMDHSTEKWTMYFLNEEELQLLRSLKSNPRLTALKELLEVDVGIVTGLNKFFVLTGQELRARKLENYTQPIVGRSTHLQGAVFSRGDWDKSLQDGAAAHLLRFPDTPLDGLTNAAQSYIAEGELAGFHQGYKCRIRKRWYVVPSVWIPDAFMLRQIHTYPKIILNEAGATSTDTIHRVKFRSGISPQAVTGAFLNSLTFAFSEITGRSYGGGVLELEPNEAERLPLPFIGAEKLDLNELDRCLRAGKIEDVLNITDAVLLKQDLGLTDDEIHTLRGIWKKLRDRRINRK